MTFTPDTRHTGTLTGDPKSANATFTADSSSILRTTWGSDFNTWAQELHTWAQLVSPLTLDTKN